MPEESVESRGGLLALFVFIFFVLIIGFATTIKPIVSDDEILVTTTSMTPLLTTTLNSFTTTIPQWKSLQLQLIEAISNNNSAFVAFLLSQTTVQVDYEFIDKDQPCRPCPIVQIDYPCAYRFTALHRAAQCNVSLEIIRMVIAKSQNQVNRREFYYGWTPLYYAVWANNLEVTKLLIEKGAQIDASEWTGQRPLHFGAQKGSSELVALLLQKGGPNAATARDQFNRTVLHWAAEVCNVEAMGVLLKNYSEQLINSVDVNTWTPLHFAAFYAGSQILSATDPIQSRQLFNCVKILIENNATINVISSATSHIYPNRGAVTPLQLVRGRNAEIEQFLVDNGALV